MQKLVDLALWILSALVLFKAFSRYPRQVYSRPIVPDYALVLTVDQTASSQDDINSAQSRIIGGNEGGSWGAHRREIKKHLDRRTREGRRPASEGNVQPEMAPCTIQVVSYLMHAPVDRPVLAIQRCADARNSTLGTLACSFEISAEHCFESLLKLSLSLTLSLFHRMPDPWLRRFQFERASLPNSYSRSTGGNLQAYDGELWPPLLQGKRLLTTCPLSAGSWRVFSYSIVPHLTSNQTCSYHAYLPSFSFQIPWSKLPLASSVSGAFSPHALSYRELIPFIVHSPSSCAVTSSLPFIHRLLARVIPTYGGYPL